MCRDMNRNTPLHLAAQTGHKDIVKFLTVEIHCSSTNRDANSVTALHIAATSGHLNIVKFVISDQNCDPDI